MADPAPAPAPGGQSSSATPPAYDHAAFTALQGKMDTLSHQLNGLSAAIRVSAKEKTPPDDGQPTQEQRDTVKGLREEIERDRRVAREEKVDAALDKFCTQNNVANSKLFKMFVRSEHMQDGSREKVTVTNGEVMFDNGLGEIKPFAELGKKILSSQDGATFLPPLSTPGAVGQRTGQGVPGMSPSLNVANMSVEDMQKDLPKVGAAIGAMARQLLDRQTTRS